jgi:preprotein translocase subunit SecG
MEFLFPIVLAIHFLVGAAIIGLVLLQHGKGADMGAAFGSGASGSLFGASGSANFLSRTTAALAAVFFLTSLALTWVATNRPKTPGSIMDSGQPAPLTVPVPGGTTPPAAGGTEQKAAAEEGTKAESAGAAAKSGTVEGAAAEGQAAGRKAVEGESKPSTEALPKSGAGSAVEGEPVASKTAADKKAASGEEGGAPASKVKEIPK